MTTEIDTQHSWGNGIHVCSNEALRLFPGEDNSKNLLLQTQRANFNHIWHKASLDEWHSRLFKIKSHAFFKEGDYSNF